MTNFLPCAVMSTKWYVVVVGHGFSRVLAQNQAVTIGLWCQISSDTHKATLCGCGHRPRLEEILNVAVPKETIGGWTQRTLSLVPTCGFPFIEVDSIKVSSKKLLNGLISSYEFHFFPKWEKFWLLLQKLNILQFVFKYLKFSIHENLEGFMAFF